MISVGRGHNKVILTSPDGVNWTKRYSEFTGEMKCVAWNGTQIIAVGELARIISSNDGINWVTVEPKILGLTETLESVIWTGNQFVVVGEDGVIITSTDGKKWKPSVLGRDEDGSRRIPLYSVAYSSKNLVAVGSGGTILTQIIS